ncbi:MAG: radical SAM family heme chaperone HemW [Bacilli bacterium]|nr:radical SAM family heme chaperone HemW [Bacilli bacterium]
MPARSLYVHIPFCRSICGYCDFTKLLYREEFSFAYIQELKKEILSKNLGPMDTIYVGGGTPSALSLDELQELFSLLARYVKDDTEFTVEANPESFDLEKAKLFASFGVNRLSFGLESAREDALRMMGREHSLGDLQNALNIARGVGISNLNVDLIYALPGEKMGELKEDIDALLSLGVPHLSTYSLTVGKGSIFAKKGMKETEQDEQAEQYELILASFRKEGYIRYEVSNFAKAGFESRHNKTYWKDEEYAGVGLGASGYEEGIRYTNTKSLAKYLAGKHRDIIEKDDEEDALKYYFLTNLRLAEGFSLSDFEHRFGFSFLTRYEKTLSSLSKRGLLRCEGGRVFPTDQGVLLLDQILLSLF